MKQPKKVLVVFYSRSGKTKKVAESVSAELKCGMEEINDTINRKGIFGYIKAGREASRSKSTVIKQIKNNPAQYDLVIIGTPIWASNMSSAIRTYIDQNKNKFKSVAFFTTMMGGGDKKAFSKMEELCGKKPVNIMSLKSGDISKGTYLEKVKAFVSTL